MKNRHLESASRIGLEPEAHSELTHPSSNGEFKPDIPQTIPTSTARVPRIKFSFRVWKQDHEWSDGHPEDILKNSKSSDDFFTKYAEESQVPFDGFRQLEFSYTDAKSRSRVVTLEKGDEEAWEDLKEKFAKLVIEVWLEINAGRRKELRVIEVGVEVKGWDWDWVESWRA